MNTRIDKGILSRYVNTVHRLGRENAPYWFVGLEEGGSVSEEELADRLERWHGRGGPPDGYLTTELTRTENHGCKHLPREGKRTHLQTTWSNQLRVLLGIRGEPLDNEVIRRLQESEHASDDPRSVTALFEIYPLPCRNSSAWPYASFGLGDAYASKSAYYRRMLSPRLDRIFKKVVKESPRVVVFTTWTQRDSIIPRVPGMRETEIGTGNRPGRAMLGRLGETVVAVCSHPADRLSDKNAFFWELGRAIANEEIRERRLAA